MREYGVYEAKTKLPDLIKQVQQGERITITNRGEPVADWLFRAGLRPTVANPVKPAPRPDTEREQPTEGAGQKRWRWW